MYLSHISTQVINMNTNQSCPSGCQVTQVTELRGNEVSRWADKTEKRGQNQMVKDSKEQQLLDGGRCPLYVSAFK